MNMSVKVTTPTKTTFGSTNPSNSGNSKISPTNFKSFASKLDDIVNLAVGRNSSTEPRPNAGKNPQSARKSRRSSEKGHSPYNQQNKKKGKHEKQKDKIKLPTKFLLGGNISDPLNLNSLNDEEINKALNAVTPVSSPLPTPAHRQQKVEVLIPPNINDPLNLNSGGDDIGLISPRSSCKKRKKNKRKKSGGELNISGDGFAQDNTKDFYAPLSLQIDPKAKVFADEIVSPAIPQDSPKHKKKKIDFKPSESKVPESIKPVDKQKSKKLVNIVPSHKPKFRPQDCKFIHGNYNRYYGKRNPGMVEDERLNNFQKEWFDGKDVLDIGCNIGHITLSIAKKFTPNSIVGMDIDPKLISIARKNVKHYISADDSSIVKFPVSLPSTYGPVANPAIGNHNDGKPLFPDNINFVQGNYVLDNDELLDLQTEEFDVILALSITKWMHLNNGDSGLKRAFRRMFKQLRPGGKLILEPQPRRTYKKKKNLSETIWKNFHEIQLWPEKFRSYLLSPEVGFMRCEFLEVPYNKSKGFQRPIIVFTKAETRQTTPREVTESRGVTPLMNIDCGGHSFTPRFDDPSSHTATPNYDLHPSFSFSSQHMPIRGYDAFLENQVNRAFTPTQELIAVTARTVTPRFDIGTPSVSARNTPSHTIQCSENDSNDRWVHSQGSTVDDQLFDQLSDEDSDGNSMQSKDIEQVESDTITAAKGSPSKKEQLVTAIMDKDTSEDHSTLIPNATVPAAEVDEMVHCEAPVMETDDDPANITGCCSAESSSQTCSFDERSSYETNDPSSCINVTNFDSVSVNISSETSENFVMQKDSAPSKIDENISEKTEKKSSDKHCSEDMTNDDLTEKQ